MRMGSAEPRREASFDLTPMIDVVLLLIVFFCLTSQFTEPRTTPIELPRVRGEAASSEAASSLVIDLEADGRVTVMGRTAEASRIAHMLPTQIAGSRSGLGSLDVLVRADRRARTADLDALLRALADSGVRHWKLATAGGEI